MTPERARLERFLTEELDLHDAETRFADHEEDALKAVCHALLWICSLDEFHRKAAGTSYEEARDADECGRYVRALRYARNRALHQFPQLLSVTDGGARLPALLPAPFFEIEWKRLAELPPPDPGRKDPIGERLYEELLADNPVRFAFDAVRDWFRRVL